MFERGLGFFTLSNEAAATLMPKLCDYGIFSPKLLEPTFCPKCEAVSKKQELVLKDLNGKNITWCCSSCPFTLPLRKRLSEKEQGWWLDQVCIRKQLVILWHLSFGSNVKKTALAAEVHSQSVRLL